MRHRSITLLAFCALALLTFIVPRFTSEAAGAASVDPAAQQRRRRTVQRPRASNQRRRRGARIDYSKFSHRTAQHRQACDSCHTIPTPNWTTVRAAEPFPDVTDYPDHDACINCHRQQFFVGARPVICTLCHTNVSPRNGARFAFQNPNEGGRGIQKPKSESQFTTKFPHDVHQDVMAQVRPSHEPRVSFVRASFSQAAQPAQVDSCTICHQTFEAKARGADAPAEQPMAGQPADFPKEAFWPEKGTFKTSPTSHASCFNCHWRDGGEKPLANNCVACHELLPAGVNLTTATSDATMKAHTDGSLPFSRAIANADIREEFLKRKSVKFVHEIPKHEERGCTSCHLTITGADDLKGKTLDVPLLSCAPCHIDARTRKELNKEVAEKRENAAFQCVKCHANFGKDPIPVSHNEAVPAPKK